MHWRDQDLVVHVCVSLDFSLTFSGPRDAGGQHIVINQRVSETVVYACLWRPRCAGKSSRETVNHCSHSQRWLCSDLIALKIVNYCSHSQRWSCSDHVLQWLASHHAKSWIIAHIHSDGFIVWRLRWTSSPLKSTHVYWLHAAQTRPLFLQPTSTTRIRKRYCN